MWDQGVFLLGSGIAVVPLLLFALGIADDDDVEHIYLTTDGGVDNSYGISA